MNEIFNKSPEDYVPLQNEANDIILKYRLARPTIQQKLTALNNALHEYKNDQIKSSHEWTQIENKVKECDNTSDLTEIRAAAENLVAKVSQPITVLMDALEINNLDRNVYSAAKRFIEQQLIAFLNKCTLKDKLLQGIECYSINKNTIEQLLREANIYAERKIWGKEVFYRVKRIVGDLRGATYYTKLCDYANLSGITDEHRDAIHLMQAQVTKLLDKTSQNAEEAMIDAHNERRRQRGMYRIVTDTNILINELEKVKKVVNHAPAVVVCIAQTVLYELDGLKKNSEVAKQARDAITYLEQMHIDHIYRENSREAKENTASVLDQRIVNFAVAQDVKHQDAKTFLITADKNMRNFAQSEQMDCLDEMDKLTEILQNENMWFASKPSLTKHCYKDILS